MTVKELIEKLQQFNENYEVEIQFQYLSRPSMDKDIDIYLEEDESNELWKRVIIDL